MRVMMKRASEVPFIPIVIFSFFLNPRVQEFL